jgi:predicted HTH transcriptional regulator
MKGRQAQIIDCIREHGPMTDRQIQERLGLRDMNQVRPRVTELREMRVLREVGSARCPVTGRRVRVCGLGEPGVLFDGVA